MRYQYSIIDRYEQANLNDDSTDSRVFQDSTGVEGLFDQETGKGVSLLKHIGIAMDLEELLGKKVDLITDGTLLPFVRESAEKDKVLIYERAS